MNIDVCSIATESTSSVGLSCVGSRISGLIVRFSRFKSLCLHGVPITDDMIRDIILGCPLLENLFLSDCYGFTKVNVGRIVRLKTLSVTTIVPTSKTPLVEFEEKNFGSVTGCRPKFSELSCLVLQNVKIDEMLFCDFSSKFPCIKDLTVRYCDGCVGFYISSNSLEYISLADRKEELDIQLDVPNLRKFMFSGTYIPSFSCMTASWEWESDITLNCWKYIEESWFHGLKRLLKNLSLSKTTLSIELFGVGDIDFIPDIQEFTKPMVENLIVGGYSSESDSLCSVLLDGIFWSCRPKIISQWFFPLWYKCGPAKADSLRPPFQIANRELLRFLWKKLMNLKTLDSWNSKQKLVGWHELEEVNAEFSQDMQVTWQPVLGKSLSMGMHLEKQSRENKVHFRFLLRWGESDCTGPYHGQRI